jgi:hypothetical protein
MEKERFRHGKRRAKACKKKAGIQCRSRTLQKHLSLFVCEVCGMHYSDSVQIFTTPPFFLSTSYLPWINFLNSFFVM